MLPLVMATGGLNEVAGQFKAGKLRPIGISSPERLPGVDIPTFREQGVDATLVNWRGLMAPPGISAGDKQMLGDAVARMVKSDQWKKLVREREWVDLYMPADPFAAFLKDEQTRLSALLKELGIG
jgi:putative tricarboxylic transport membrane protein